jgi:hypothetical protein
MKLKSRLSIGDVYGKVATKENLLKMIGGEELDIATIIGVATRIVAKEDGKFGVSYKIMGDFKMTNLKTGEMHRGSTLYLPSVGNSVIAAQLADESVTSCQFAFKITARYDETSPVQYVYDFEPLIAAAKNDPIALLEAAIAQKRLPSDVAEETPTTGAGSHKTDELTKDAPTPDEVDIAKAKAKAKKEKVAA